MHKNVSLTRIMILLDLCFIRALKQSEFYRAAWSSHKLYWKFQDSCAHWKEHLAIFITVNCCWTVRWSLDDTWNNMIQDRRAIQIMEAVSSSTPCLLSVGVLRNDDLFFAGSSESSWFLTKGIRNAVLVSITDWSGSNITDLVSPAAATVTPGHRVAK